MKVGNKVRITQREHGHEFVLGGVGVISETDDKAGDFCVSGVSAYWWCRPEEVEVITQDEPVTAVNRPKELWED